MARQITAKKVWVSYRFLPDRGRRKSPRGEVHELHALVDSAQHPRAGQARRKRRGRTGKPAYRGRLGRQKGDPWGVRSRGVVVTVLGESRTS